MTAIEVSPDSVVRRAEARLADDATATPRTLISKLKEITSLKDYPVDDTGATSINALLQKASDVGNSLVIPAGDYLVDANITINVPVEFLAGAKFLLNTGVVLTFNCEIYADKYQQIFQCAGTSRVLLEQAHSLCWYGAQPDNTGDTGPFLMTALDGATNRDVDGYGRIGGHIFVPAGQYRFTTPIVHKADWQDGIIIYGEPFTGNLAGGYVTSRFNWYGTAPTFIYYRGVNNSTFQDLQIRSEAGPDCQALVWFDSIIAQTGYDVNRDRGSTGMAVVRCHFSIGNGDAGAGPRDCLLTTACLALGNANPGEPTSQVSEIHLDRLQTQGQNVQKGIGLHVRGGGNVKVFMLNKFYATHLGTGISWDSASSYMQLTDCSWAYNTLDIKQAGGGKLIVIGGNSEGSYDLLFQSAGIGGCEADFNSFEFSGQKNTGGLRNIVTVRGGVTLTNCYIRVGYEGTDTDAETTPWFMLANNIRYSPTNYFDAPTETHCALTLINTSISNGYNDGIGIQFPIRDGSGNAVYQVNGSFAGYNIPLWVEGCFSHQNSLGGTGVKIQQRKTGPQHLYVRTKAELATALTSHLGLVTTGGNVSFGDSGGRTYYYDVNSATAIDGDLVEDGPGTAPGRFHRYIQDQFIVGTNYGTTKYTKIDVLGIGNCPAIAIGGGTPRADPSGPIANITGSTTGGVFVNIDPTSIQNGYTVLNVDLPAMPYGYPLNQQGNCSDTLIGQLFNYHATGVSQQYIHSTAGDCVTRWGNATKDVSAGLDHSANSWVVSNHYLLGTNNILDVELTTKAVKVYGPIESVTNSHLELNPQGTGKLKIGTAAIAGAGVASTHKLEIKDSAGVSYYVLLELK